MRLPPSTFPSFKAGTRSPAFVENVDLLPTLVELAMPDEPAIAICPVDANTTRTIR
jgi:hypothetical protein